MHEPSLTICFEYLYVTIHVESFAYKSTLQCIRHFLQHLKALTNKEARLLVTDKFAFQQQIRPRGLT